MYILYKENGFYMSKKKKKKKNIGAKVLVLGMLGLMILSTIIGILAYL